MIGSNTRAIGWEPTKTTEDKFAIVQADLEEVNEDSEKTQVPYH